MAVEIFRAAPKSIDGLMPLALAPDIPEKPTIDSFFSNVQFVPEHLTRRALKERRKKYGSISERLWSERGRAVEIYVQDVINTQTDIVDHVEIREQPDAEGPDLIAHFIKRLAVPEADIEVKSSSCELRNGKQKIRDNYFEEEIRGTMIGPWTTEAMAAEMTKKSEEWNKKSEKVRERFMSVLLTDEGLILINGGEKDLKEKTPEEILRDSFYPQLTRMVEKAVGEPLNVPKDQLMLFPGLTLLWFSEYGRGIQPHTPRTLEQIQFGKRSHSGFSYSNPK